LQHNATADPRRHEAHREAPQRFPASGRAVCYVYMSFVPLRKKDLGQNPGDTL
jgi:hypothetical protein